MRRLIEHQAAAGGPALSMDHSPYVTARLVAPRLSEVTITSLEAAMPKVRPGQVVSICTNQDDFTFERFLVVKGRYFRHKRFHVPEGFVKWKATLRPTK